MSNTATASNYQLTTATGRNIRIATMVTYADGTEVRFTERMPKGEAIRQAAALRVGR